MKTFVIITLNIEVSWNNPVIEDVKLVYLNENYANWWTDETQLAYLWKDTLYRQYIYSQIKRHQLSHKGGGPYIVDFSNIAGKTYVISRFLALFVPVLYIPLSHFA